MKQLTSITCATRSCASVRRAATPLVGIPGSALCGKIRAALRHRTSSISCSLSPTASSARSFASPVSIVMSHPQSMRDAPTRRVHEIEHAAIDAAAREIDVDVRDVAHGRAAVRPVAAAADVREDERRARMPQRERAEIDAVGDLLAGPLARAMLPDVMQHRQPAFRCLFGDRIEQRIVGAAARRELDADGAALRRSARSRRARARCRSDSP